MERATAVQATGVFLVTLAAGLPFALDVGRWLAGPADQATTPTPVHTVYVDAGKSAPAVEPVQAVQHRPAPQRTLDPTASPSASATPSAEPSTSPSPPPSSAGPTPPAPEPSGVPVPTPTQPEPGPEPSATGPSEPTVAPELTPVPEPSL
ncbi:MAG TPA: hypothetical protein VNV66_11445 [Pilimelia sp.]|nr:hypothetical protein [Pilimelia sp.]